MPLTTDGPQRSHALQVHFSSATDEWATPHDLFGRLNAIFHFTLDPCATPANAKCKRYFTIADDGLRQDWDGERVFMNPPYGRAIVDWVKKASEAKALVVCLLPARTDTRWWHDYVVGRGASVSFLKGRLRFSDSAASAPFPSAIVIFTGGALTKTA
jgi:phage N-6-adenine-methyltransferase